jgi:hypothetical protein
MILKIHLLSSLLEYSIIEISNNWKDWKRFKVGFNHFIERIRKLHGVKQKALRKMQPYFKFNDAMSNKKIQE